MKFSLDRACKAIHDGLHPHQPEEISQVAEPVMDHPDTCCEQSGDDKRERMYTDASTQTDEQDEQLLQQMVAVPDVDRSEDYQSLQHTVAALDADRSEDKQSSQYMVSAPDADETEDDQPPEYTETAPDVDRLEDNQSLQYTVAAPDVDESEDNELPPYVKNHWGCDNDYEESTVPWLCSEKMCKV